MAAWISAPQRPASAHRDGASCAAPAWQGGRSSPFRSSGRPGTRSGKRASGACARLRSASSSSASSVAWWRRVPRRPDAALAGFRPKPEAGLFFCSCYSLAHRLLRSCGRAMSQSQSQSQSQSLYNEMYDGDRNVRPHYDAFCSWLAETPRDRIAQNRHAADLLFHRVGTTFAVYGEASGTERLIPFDIVPHVIPGPQWSKLQRGFRQRVVALNRFLHDIYHGQEILHAGKIPADQAHHNAHFRREMVDVDVPGGVYAHIAGVDLVRHADGEYYVLEDNLRTPSGVSYMLENRKMMMRLFPELFANQAIRPVDHYPDLLLETLRGVAHRSADNATIVLLTPGHHNSAYFEHAFLAQQMGIELVEGQDLFVANT